MFNWHKVRSNAKIKGRNVFFCTTVTCFNHSAVSELVQENSYLLSYDNR